MWLDEAQWDHPLDDNIAYFTYFILFYFISFQLPQYTVEWAIPYEQSQSCLRALGEWMDRELANSRGIRPHFPIEIRFTKDDDIWLSPSHGRQSTWIGLVQYKCDFRSSGY